MHKDLKLCPDCPMRGWISEAVKRIKDRRFIRSNSDPPSSLKVCIELRKIRKELDLDSCPYYPESETLLNYLSKTTP